MASSALVERTLFSLLASRFQVLFSSSRCRSVRAILVRVDHQFDWSNFSLSSTALNVERANERTNVREKIDWKLYLRGSVCCCCELSATRFRLGATVWPFCRIFWHDHGDKSGVAHLVRAPIGIDRFHSIRERSAHC